MRPAVIACLLLSLLAAGCAAFSQVAPPPEDTRALRDLSANLKAAMVTQAEVHREEAKRWADRLTEVALGEIHQATLDELKGAQIAGTLDAAKVRSIMDTAEAMRRRAVKAIQDRFAASTSLRIDAEVREMVEWLNTYLLARVGLDEANRELLQKVKDLAAEVGVDKYLPPLPGEVPQPAGQ